MITKRRLVVFAAATLMLSLAVPVSAEWSSFGDSSFWLGTALDQEVPTVCSDGFDFSAAVSPNGVADPTIDVGSPTGFADGELVVGTPLWQIYAAGDILFDNGDGTYGSLLLNLAWADAGDGTTRLVYTDIPDAPVRYGVFTTDIFYDDTYFAVDGIEFGDGTTRPVAGIGTDFTVPDVPLPVGSDVAFIAQNSGEFPQVVGVVSCTADDVQVDAKPYGKDTAVKPGKGKIKVAVLNDGGHDLTTLSGVTAGVGLASPTKDKMKDVDDDGDLDAEYSFWVADTGIACGDTELLVQGTVDGLSFSATADIVTKC